MRNVSRLGHSDESESILKRLAILHASLSSAHKRIADQILSNPMESIGQSISELATCAEVSDATVTRFCAAIGLPGYPELRKALVSALRRADDENPKSPCDEALDQLRNLHISTRRPLNEIIAVVAHARRTILGGFGSSALLCEYLASQFIGQLDGLRTLGFGGTVVAEKYIETCRDDDVLIFLTNLDRPCDDINFVRLSEQKGLTVIWASSIRGDGVESGSFEELLRSTKINFFNSTLTSLKSVHHVLESASVSRKCRGIPLR